MSNRQKYLFILKKPSLENRKKATEYLQKIGIVVSAQFGVEAVIGQGPESRVEEARKSEWFYGVFSKQIKELPTGLSEEQKRIIEQWNFSFSREYQKIREDKTHEGKKWSAEGMHPPRSSSHADRELLKSELLKKLGITEAKFIEQYKTKAAKMPKLEGKEFMKYERLLAEKYGDETVAYYLARMAADLRAEFQWVIANPTPIVAEWLKPWVIAFFESATWKLENEISVGIVFVESSLANGPTFSAADRLTLRQEIIDGLTWLSEYEPKAKLSWVYDWQYTKIDVANGIGDPTEDYWRNPAMQKVNYNGKTYTGDMNGAIRYRSDMRIQNFSAHAIVIFVTPYANEWFAYANASWGRVTLAQKWNWGGWGLANINRILAHEVCHIFGATDEYTGSGTPCSSCGGQYGAYKIPNGNCGTCATPHQVCLMDQNTLSICGYTQAHIGWSDIFVELTTANVVGAGSSDSVWLEVAGKQFLLDTPNFNDRQQGNREGYPLNYSGVGTNQITTIGVRKAADSAGGDWMLSRIRFWCNGTLMCDKTVNQWLKNPNLYYQV